MKENGVRGKAEKREKVKKTERFQGSACDNILYVTKVMGLKYMKDHNTVVFLDVFYESKKGGSRGGVDIRLVQMHTWYLDELL